MTSVPGPVIDWSKTIGSQEKSSTLEQITSISAVANVPESRQRVTVSRVYGPESRQMAWKIVPGALSRSILWGRIVRLCMVSRRSSWCRLCSELQHHPDTVDKLRYLSPRQQDEAGPVLPHGKEPWRLRSKLPQRQRI